MRGHFKKSVFSIIFILSFMLSNYVVKADIENFSDVPAGHWAYNDILTLRKLNVTQGISENTFGLGRTMTRAEFVTFLSKLFNWTTRSPQANEAWYAVYVDASVSAGAVTKAEGAAFRPDIPITREEIAVMLIRSLGYDSLAQQLSTLQPPFNDVKRNSGYISIAKDFGLIYGISENTFSPDSSATREQGAAMMARLYNKLNSAKQVSLSSGWVNAFYAIRSNNQSNLMNYADSVSFGWSRIEWRDGVYLNTTSAQKNEYSKPDGYESVLSDVRAKNKQALLMVTVENKMVSSVDSGGNGSQTLSSYLLGNERLRQRMVSLIAAAAADFDGVTIDIENLTGNQARQDFITFLTELKSTLTPQSNHLYVAVQPVRQPGEPYYDGYDYRAIGKAADKVILMAHDYYAKSLTEEEMISGFNVTPLTPINEVYYALKAITDPNSGVEDVSKILLQFSFDTVQWKMQQGQIINKEPFNPTYEAITNRIALGAIPQYSYKYENPFITFFNDEDATDNIVWYENKQSITAKMKLASMFQINGISLWRLGIIPDDIIVLLSK